MVVTMVVQILTQSLCTVDVPISDRVGNDGISNEKYAVGILWVGSLNRKGIGRQQTAR